MMSRAERVKEFANILTGSRYKAGVSQEWMAAELGVSRKTIQNWESGVSSPTMFQFLEWFRAVKLNPTPYLFDFFNSDVRKNKNLSSDEKLDETFNRVSEQLTIHQKRCLVYLLTGTYQGDPYSMLQLFVAHAHLPMQHRFFIANQIAETYKMCESSGMLKDTEYVLPDMATLDRAIKAGRDAAIRGEETYSISIPEDVEAIEDEDKQGKK